MIVENGEIDNNNGIVKNCIIIAMDNIKFEDNDMMISSLGDFFQNIGESDCDCGAFNGRIDPLLKLYNNCELMLTTNEDISHGKANGILLNFVKVILKRKNSI